MNWRMFIESWIIISCGLLLLSPVFNSMFIIPYISVVSNISNEIISHFAVALIPIILVSIIELFKGD